MTKPRASTGSRPNRLTSIGTSVCMATVAANITVVTRPAAPAGVPMEIEYSGSDDSVRKKLANASTLR